MENNKVVASYKGLKPTENNSPKFKRIEDAINKEGFGYEIVKENGRIIGIKFNNFYPTKDEIEIFEAPKVDKFGTYVVGKDPYEIVTGKFTILGYKGDEGTYHIDNEKLPQNILMNDIMKLIDNEIIRFVPNKLTLWEKIKKLWNTM